MKGKGKGKAPAKPPVHGPPRNAGGPAAAGMIAGQTAAAVAVDSHGWQQFPINASGGFSDGVSFDGGAAAFGGGGSAPPPPSYFAAVGDGASGVQMMARPFMDMAGGSLQYTAHSARLKGGSEEGNGEATKTIAAPGKTVLRLCPLVEEIQEGDAITLMFWAADGVSGTVELTTPHPSQRTEDKNYYI